ncbi:MAG: CRISPR system precrRNA processing endoribonuclease RAMP protein Cas6 [Acidobacteriota bacterium]|nr:CRISPR system precrRNA processing endoribonuclease RAMP protein Cas6 [Acidobacteriota bacterium]
MPTDTFELSAPAPKTPAWTAYPLPLIPHLRLRVTLHSEGSAVLPAFKGSLLRGAFGHALRKAACAMGPGQDCASCRLRIGCVYTRLFETFVEGEPPPFLHGLSTAPRPYVLEPADEVRAFAPGDPLGFDLLLLGQAIGLHAYALLALERMAAAGLGRDRHRFTLDRVSALTPDGGWQDLWRGGALQAGAPPLPSFPQVESPLGDRATLHFLTPTRIKFRDHLVDTVTFRALAFAILRRTLELAHFHLPGAAVDWTFRPLLEQAGEVRIAASRLHWHDWQRYSNRQKTSMSLGGFVGQLEIEGGLGPFTPLLRTAEILHVGKGATFGLGRLRID